MKIRVSKNLGFEKELYNVTAVSEDMQWFKIINDDGEEDWLGMYCIYDVIYCGTCLERKKQRETNVYSVVCGLCDDFALWQKIKGE